MISGRSRRDLSQDDLTIKLSEIVTVNNIIRNALAGGKALVPFVMEDWEYLQLQCAMYLNGANVPNVRPEWCASIKRRQTLDRNTGQHNRRSRPHFRSPAHHPSSLMASLLQPAVLFDLHPRLTLAGTRRSARSVPSRSASKGSRAGFAAT